MLPAGRASVGQAGEEDVHDSSSRLSMAAKAKQEARAAADMASVEATAFQNAADNLFGSRRRTIGKRMTVTLLSRTVTSPCFSARDAAVVLHRSPLRLRPTRQLGYQ